MPKALHQKGLTTVACIITGLLGIIGGQSDSHSFVWLRGFWFGAPVAGRHEGHTVRCSDVLPDRFWKLLKRPSLETLHTPMHVAWSPVVSHSKEGREAWES